MLMTTYVSVECVFMCSLFCSSLCWHFVPLYFLAGFAPLQLGSGWAVVLQFRFQASFISYVGVTAFLIFQTNGHVSIAACQFWFYDSFIIKFVRLQCSATDGLLHFSHGQGMSLLYVYVGEEGKCVLAHVSVCLHLAMGGFQVCPSHVRADVSWTKTVQVTVCKMCMLKSIFKVVCLIDLSLVTSV